MRWRMHRKPDLITWLTLIVGLGVVFTTKLQAGGLAPEATDPPGFAAEPSAEARLAAARDLAGRLHLRWMEAGLQKEGVRHLVSGAGLPLGSGSARHGGAMRLGWRAPDSIRAAEREASGMGSGIPLPHAPRRGLFLTFQKRW